jgi:hypothetical protein
MEFFSQLHPASLTFELKRRESSSLMRKYQVQ